METLHSLQNKLVQLGSANLPNRTNVGTPNSGVKAIEYGNAYQHTTVLSINKSAAFALADNAAKGVGYLIYTLPAGALIVNNAHMALTITNTEHTANTDGELGLGTTIATGAVAVLSGTAGFENILTALPSYGMGTVGISTDISNSTVGIGGLIIPAASAHTVHVNLASTWANTAGLALDADITGFVVLNWTFLV
jgi:hypothetical protein